MQQALKKSTDKVLLKPKKSAMISMLVVGAQLWLQYRRVLEHLSRYGIR